MIAKSELVFTLLCDGSSDKVLVKILTWIIRKQLTNVSIRVEFGDLRKLPNSPKKLEERMQKVLEYYPCDVLFVHRDAEKHSLESRKQEVIEAWRKIKNTTISDDNIIAVIPVRMTEAWLLLNEESIKIAAGNPNNKNSLSLPSLHHVEDLPNPKAVLHQKIKEASNLQGRKLAKLKIPQRVHVLVDNITDFSPLRQLSAFQKLEKDIKTPLLTT